MYKKIAILTIIFFTFACEGKTDNSQESDNRIVVEVVKANKETAHSFLEYSGVLQPVSQVDVFPEVTGKIEKIEKYEGDEVEKNTVLARIEETDYQIAYDQAAAALQLATANFENARSNFTRQDSLAKDGFTSRAALEGVQTAYKIASAQSDQAKAAVEMAERQLNRTRITSPISGYISYRSIDAGQQVSPAAPAFTVQNIRKLKVNLSLSESGLSSVSTRSEVIIRSEHFPERTFSGKVVFISRSASPDGGFPVRIEMENPNLTLAAGWTVTVEIYRPESGELVALPGKAILKKSGKWTAFIVKDDTAVEKQIELMSRIRDKVYIRSGIEPDQWVIVRGQEYCKSGEPVQVSREWENPDEFLKKNHR